MSISPQFSHRIPLSFLTLLAIFLVIGCSVGDFIGAYFNTYYNARRLFNDAEEEIWNQPDTRQTGRNYLVPVSVTPNAKTKFTSVIEKCSKLLQYHPESSLVDESLLMIGKSYFYQGDYQKAERKFRELIEGTGGSLVPEARMLLAYTYYRMGNSDSARVQAKAIAGQEDAGKDVRCRTSLLLGKIEQDNGNFDQARVLYEHAATNAPNDALESNAWLQTAEMYGRLGDYANAEVTYRRASSAGSDYVAEYRGNIGAARMRAREGKFEDALDALQVLRDNNNYREFFGEIDLDRAAVLDTMGNIQEAVRQYRFVDTSYARTATAARSYYRQGLLYEKKLGLYDSARAAYNKGKNEFAQADVTPQLVRRADALNRYDRLRNDLARYDSIQTALLTPPSVSLPDSARTDTVRTDSLAGQHRQAPIKTMSLDSVKYQIALNMTELAGLFYTGLDRPDSAAIWYTRVLIGYPLSPFAPRALYTLAQLYNQDSTHGQARADSLYHEIIRRYPQSPFAAEARRVVGLPPVPVRTDEAEALYAKAEQMIEEGKGQEALEAMRRIVAKFPTSPQAPRAQYAVGWIFEYMIDKADSALTQYRKLLEVYPSSPFAAKVQLRLPAPAAQQDTSSTSSAVQQKPQKKVSDEMAEEERLREERMRRQPAPGHPGAESQRDTSALRRRE